jgi:aminopeptidase
MDPRISKLARVLIHYSLKLKKGQLIKIQGEVVALPLVQAAFEEAVKVGAHPYTQIIVPETVESLLEHGNREQLLYASPLQKLEVARIDALLHIWGSQNTKYLSGTDPRQQALAQRARRPLTQKFYKRVADKTAAWVGTQFPTQADAQQAEMSLADYEDFVYRAGHIHRTDPVKHWQKVAREQKRLVRILNRIDRLHITADGTDLRLRAKGRKWISCHGTENFPDGEIFTSPIENSAEGRIQFSFPATYNGREVQDVSLEFKKGRVVHESAGKNFDYLKAMLDVDRGSRYVGEIAIGTNYEIKRSTGNTLFDEKIGGTCHLAVGAGMPEAGGRNKSGLHWDMVCDLKKGGEIRADGKVIYRNGKFTI